MKHELTSQHRNTSRRSHMRTVAGALLAAGLLGLAAACSAGDEPATMPAPAPAEQPDSGMTMTAVPDPEPEMPEPEPTIPTEEPTATAVTVAPSLAASTIGEGESTVLTLTASAPLDEEASFTLSATQGIAFGEARAGQPISTTPPGSRTITIAAGEREAAMTLTAIEIDDEDAEGLDAVITIASVDEEIELSAASLPLRVLNFAAVQLLDPVLITEDGLSVVLNASVARSMDRDVTVVVELPEGLFESSRATIVIPAGELVGMLMLSATSTAADGTQLSFQIASVSGSLSARAAAAEDGTAHSVTVEVERPSPPPPPPASSSNTTTSTASRPPAASSNGNPTESRVERLALTATPDVAQVDEGGIVNLDIGLSSVATSDIALDLDAPAFLVRSELMITIPRGETRTRVQLEARLVEQDTDATLRLTPRGSCCSPASLSVSVRVLDVAEGLIVVGAPAAITEGATGEELTFTLTRALTSTVQVRVTQDSSRLLRGAAFAGDTQTAVVTIPANTQSASLALETASVREDLTASLTFELLTSGVPDCCAFSRDSLDIEVRNAERLRVKLPYPPVFDEGTEVLAEITVTPPLRGSFDLSLSLFGLQNDGNILASGGEFFVTGQTALQLSLSVGFTTGTANTRLEVSAFDHGFGRQALSGYTIEGDLDLTVREVTPTPRIRVEFEKKSVVWGEPNTATFTLLEPIPVAIYSNDLSIGGLQRLGGFLYYHLETVLLQAERPVSAVAFPPLHITPPHAPPPRRLSSRFPAPHQPPPHETTTLRLSSRFPNCCHFEGDLQFTVLPRPMVTPSLEHHTIDQDSSTTLTLTLDSAQETDLEVEIRTSEPSALDIGTRTVVTIPAGHLGAELTLTANQQFDFPIYEDFFVHLDFDILSSSCCDLREASLFLGVRSTARVTLRLDTDEIPEGSSVTVSVRLPAPLPDDVISASLTFQVDHANFPYGGHVSLDGSTEFSYTLPMGFVETTTLTQLRAMLRLTRTIPRLFSIDVIAEPVHLTIQNVHSTPRIRASFQDGLLASGETTTLTLTLAEPLSADIEIEVVTHYSLEPSLWVFRFAAGQTSTSRVIMARAVSETTTVVPYVITVGCCPRVDPWPTLTIVPSQ